MEDVNKLNLLSLHYYIKLLPDYEATLVLPR